MPTGKLRCPAHGAAFSTVGGLHATTLSEQHRHCRGEKKDAATDGESVHRDAEVGEHRATCEQEEERDSESNQHCSNQNLAPPRRLFILSESNEDGHDARRVDLQPEESQKLPAQIG